MVVDSSSGETEDVRQTAVEAIAGEIVEEARALAAGKKSEAKRLASELLKKAEAEREARLKAEGERARAKAEAEANKELSLARVESKKTFLLERERLLDSALEEAGAKLDRRSEAYSGWMKRLVERFSRELPEGFTLVVDPADAALARSMFKGKMAERRIGGGAVAEGAGVVIDESWNSLLSETREKRRADIARLLFSDGR